MVPTSHVPWLFPWPREVLIIVSGVEQMQEGALAKVLPNERGEAIQPRVRCETHLSIAFHY